MKPSLKSIFLESFDNIRKNKSLFSAISSIQFVFLAVFSINLGYFSYRMMSILGSIVEVFDQLNPDEIAAGSIQNPLSLYQDYNLVMSYLAYCILFSYLIFIVFSGLSWYLSGISANKSSNKKISFIDFLKYDLKFAAVILIFTIPVFALLAVISDIFIYLDFLEPLIVIFPLVIAVMAYFMCINIALISNSSSLTLFDSIKNSFALGKKNIWKLILNYLIILIPIALLAVLTALIMYYIDSILLAVISAVILSIVISFAKIYFLVFVKELIGNRY